MIAIAAAAALAMLAALARSNDGFRGRRIDRLAALS
jgi:hypothetical protein